jgi:hypothetical protein
MMKKFMSKIGMRASAFMASAMISTVVADSAHATQLTDMVASTGNNVASFPKLISAACYVGGAAFVGTGVMKVKQHVDNPGQTPLREGLVRLGAGGVLVAAPALTNVMQTSSGVGSGNTGFSSFGSFGF